MKMKIEKILQLYFILSMLIPCSAVTAKDQACTRDSFFPDAGNCGYDVSDYTLEMTWDADGDLWDVVEDMTFTVEWDTDELHFDFTDSYEFYGLTIDGIAVDFRSEGRDLTIWHHFDHDTEYHLYAGFRGKLDYGFLFDPDGLERAENNGFCMMNEPTNAWRYFICNDHPKDKASFHYSFTVPAAFTPAGVGRLLRIREPDGSTVDPAGDFERMASPGDTEGSVSFTYEANEPMAPYLFAVCAFPYDMRQKTLEDGIVQLDFVDHSLGEFYDEAWNLADQQETIVKMFESYLGEYPYRDLGAIISPTFLRAALETQTRPIYDLSTLDSKVFAHELIHQWFGDWISVEDWSDIWIKEGAATYGEYLYLLHFMGRDAFENTLRHNYEMLDHCPGPKEISSALSDMYGFVPYYGGSFVYYALEQKLGEVGFKTGMRLLLERYAGSTVNEEKFIETFSEAAGEDLTGFIRSWLYYGEGHVPDLPGIETYEEARAK